MNKLIILSVLSFLIACKTGVRESPNLDSAISSPDTVTEDLNSALDELHDSDYGIYHYPLVVNASLPTYSLKIQLPEKKLFLYSNTDEKGIPQEFSLGEDINHDEGYFVENPEANLNIADYNFDGFKDLAIVQQAGTANVVYEIFLFGPSSLKFVKHQALSELSAPEVDSVNRVIHYHNSGGMAGGWYTAGIIQWKEQRPVVVREEDQTSSEEEPEIFIRTIRILNEQGQMILASKVQIQRYETEKEKQCLLEGNWIEFDRYPNLLFAKSQANVIRVDGRQNGC